MPIRLPRWISNIRNRLRRKKPATADRGNGERKPSIKATTVVDKALFGVMVRTTQTLDARKVIVAASKTARTANLSSELESKMREFQNPELSVFLDKADTVLGNHLEEMSSDTARETARRVLVSCINSRQPAAFAETLPDFIRLAETAREPVSTAFKKLLKNIEGVEEAKRVRNIDALLKQLPENRNEIFNEIIVILGQITAATETDLAHRAEYKGEKFVRRRKFLDQLGSITEIATRVSGAGNDPETYVRAQLARIKADFTRWK